MQSTAERQHLLAVEWKDADMEYASARISARRAELELKDTQFDASAAQAAVDLALMQPEHDPMDELCGHVYKDGGGDCRVHNGTRSGHSTGRYWSHEFVPSGRYAKRA
jgi:hypothetical protein